jgi:hypothetical protein
MVAYPGTTVCADRLRPLNQPRPIRVETDDQGYPVAVDLGRQPSSPGAALKGGPRTRLQARGASLFKAGTGESRTGALVAVAEVLDRWRIDDEWWRPALQGDGAVGRAEISRMYYHVALENRQLLVIFRDLTEGGWYAQTNATPLTQPAPVEVLTPRIPAAASTAAAPSDRAVPSIRRIGIG